MLRINLFLTKRQNTSQIRNNLQATELLRMGQK